MRFIFLPSFTIKYTNKYKSYNLNISHFLISNSNNFLGLLKIPILIFFMYLNHIF